MNQLETGVIVAIAAFIVGLVFGATAQRTNFCTMGGISDHVLMGDGRRLRAWVLATAVALIGTQILSFAGYIDLSKSIYLTTNFGWLGAIGGGLVFGFGMTMTGGCPSRTLVRLGGGNLKSLVVALVLGITAYMTLRGLFAPARVAVENASNIDLSARGFGDQSLGHLLAAAFGLNGRLVEALVAIVLAAGLLIYCFKDEAFRKSPGDLTAGVVIGLMVVAGWAVTGILGFDDFEPTQLASMTLIAPTANALQYLMTYTGASLDFGIASVGGVLAGSFISAVASGEFRIEAFTEAGDMIRHIIGAVMMGVGGVLALGCTIGQGVTGVSTLAVGSLMAWAAIMAGGYFGIKYLEEGTFGGALKATFARN